LNASSFTRLFVSADPALPSGFSFGLLECLGVPDARAVLKKECRDIVEPVPFSVLDRSAQQRGPIRRWDAIRLTSDSRVELRHGPKEVLFNLVPRHR
jgi:hypothetical protein